MQLSISTNRNYTPAFSGKYERTQEGNLYYKTNSGIKIGGTLAAITALSNFFKKPMADFSEQINEMYLQSITKNKKNKSEKDFAKLKKIYDDQKIRIETLRKVPTSRFVIAGLGVAAVHSIFGYVADYYRNKQSAETADKIAKQGLQRTLSEDYDENIKFSRNRRPYVKANNAVKTGIASGIAAGSLMYMLNGIKEVEKVRNNLLATLIVAGFGGWLLTHYADKLANKDAAKNA